MTTVRRLMVVMIVVMAGVFTLPTATRAQVDGLHLTLYPWFGIGDFARDTNFDDETIWGGTLGLGINKYLGIEGHLGKMNTQTINGFTHYGIGAPPGPPRSGSSRRSRTRCCGAPRASATVPGSGGNRPAAGDR